MHPPGHEPDSAIPANLPFVGTSAYRVFFPVEEESWHWIPPHQRAWFASADEAQAAGYRAAPASIEGLEEFDLIGEIGRGATSTVYRARDRMLDREVAIKVVHPSHHQDEETLARCHREARVVARLQHPGIVSVYAVHRLPSRGLALVMEHIPGRTLRDVIQEQGPLPLEIAERILRDVAEALAAAHAEGIVHRDVKPQNIFIHEATGRGLLADFGIAIPLGDAARITHSGAVIGTPAYMSPEQFDGTLVDGRSDLYSLALVGWEMLTGSSPWQGEGLFNIIYLQKTSPVPPLRAYRRDVPARLRIALERALEKNPEDRWESIEAFLTCVGGQASGWRRRLAALWPFRHRHLAPTAPGAVPSPSPAPYASAGTDAPTVRLPVHLAAGERVRRRSHRIPPVLRGPRSRAAASALLAVTAVAAAGTGIHLQSSTLTRDNPAAVATAPTPTHGLASSALERPTAGAEFIEGLEPWSERLEGGPLLDPPMVLDATDPVLGFALPEEMADDDAPALAEAEATETAEATALTPSADSVELPPEPAPPPRLPLDDRPWRVASGGLHSCGIEEGGQLVCWGGNERGQSGRSSTARAPLPTTIELAGAARSVSVGGFHSCVLDEGGAAHCWGENREGQLGGGSAGAGAGGAMVRVQGPRFVTLSTGLSHSCGITSDRVAYCWGANADGQLGDASAENRAQPVRVRTAEPLVGVAAGWTHSCALTSTGAAVCWGGNARGQLGDGNTSASRSPVFVSGDLRFTSVTAGGAHSCGLTEDGAAFCWGQNNDGRLGDGTLQDRYTPARVNTPERFSSISAGGRHTCALTTSGRAFCWGHNGYGQVGDGSEVARSAPVPVNTELRFVAIRSGGSHSCAVTSQGDRYCWGYNIEGQLGDGTLTNRSVPTPVQPREVQSG